ncbi:hypothetical protein OFM39_29030, partial [Escherichia coli]|nr:hypothetical protein [Escherichia coli]
TLDDYAKFFYKKKKKKNQKTINLVDFSIGPINGELAGCRTTVRPALRHQTPKQSPTPFALSSCPNSPERHALSRACLSIILIIIKEKKKQF